MNRARIDKFSEFLKITGIYKKSNIFGEDYQNFKDGINLMYVKSEFLDFYTLELYLDADLRNYLKLIIVDGSCRDFQRLKEVLPKFNLDYFNKYISEIFSAERKRIFKHD